MPEEIAQEFRNQVETKPQDKNQSQLKSGVKCWIGTDPWILTKSCLHSYMSMIILKVHFKYYFVIFMQFSIDLHGHLNQQLYSSMDPSFRLKNKQIMIQTSMESQS